MTIEKVIEDLELRKKHKEDYSWVVRHNGSVLTMHSGKSVWRLKNHATTAFISHIASSYAWSDMRAMGFSGGKELAHYLINNDIVKIEKL